MSKFMYNGKPYGGSTNYASSVACTDAEGNESTVQAEIDKNRDDIDELNKKSIKTVTMSITTDANGLAHINGITQSKHLILSVYTLGRLASFYPSKANPDAYIVVIEDFDSTERIFIKNVTVDIKVVYCEI